VLMRATLTIRADEKLRAALRKWTAIQGETVSELAREILNGAPRGFEETLRSASSPAITAK